MKYLDLLRYTNTWIFLAILLVAIVDIFLIKSYIDVIEFLIFLGWVFMLRRSSVAKMFNYPILLSFIVLVPICLILENELAAQKLSIWVFYLFSANIVIKSVNIRSVI